MLDRFKNKFGLTLPLIVLLAFLSAPAAALNLDQAKSQGMIKELPTGYVKVVKPSPEANALAKTVNAGRKAEYKKIAEKHGISAEAVAQRAAQKLAQ